MIHYGRSTRALAVGLSALAGYVDALAFLALGGFFVSFMSGNSTRLGVGLAQGSMHGLVAAGLIITFVGGVMLGTLVGRVAKARRRPAVLALVTILLLAASCLDTLGAVHGTIVCMALAMGAENAVFEREGEVSVGVTYMTGTLVKLGQRLVAALLGGDRWAWTPYLFLWLGLAIGALAGASVYPYAGLGGLWGAAAVSAIMTMVAIRGDEATGS